MAGTPPFTDAGQAVEWINGLRYKGEKNGLTNTRALLTVLGNPERDMKLLHVAGTNGKGSTCAMLDKMLRAAGYRTGLYTSPYLMRFNERVRADGFPIPDDELTVCANIVREATEALLERDIRPTMFELTTALAFTYFSRCGVETAVIEVGLGGLHDSTNVITPEVSLISTIAMDHTKMLGDTIELIARNKGGIIKPGVPAVIGVQDSPAAREVLVNMCREAGAPCVDVAEYSIDDIEVGRYGSSFTFLGERVSLPLPGAHQVNNAALALAGISALIGRGFTGLTLPRAAAALNGVRWPGRLEWMDERTLIDGAHNPNGAEALAGYVNSHLRGGRVVMVVGMMRDKAVDECVNIYSGAADFAVCTRVDYPRAEDPERIRALFELNDVPAIAACGVAAALDAARAEAGEGGTVVVCGSLYLIGEVRLMLHDDGGRL